MATFGNTRLDDLDPLTRYLSIEVAPGEEDAGGEMVQTTPAWRTSPQYLLLCNAKAGYRQISPHRPRYCQKLPPGQLFFKLTKPVLENVEKMIKRKRQKFRQLSKDTKLLCKNIHKVSLLALNVLLTLILLPRHACGTSIQLGEVVGSLVLDSQLGLTPNSNRGNGTTYVQPTAHLYDIRLTPSS